MEFRVLGLLEVSGSGGGIELAGGRERSLLVLLLLHANEPVAPETLIEELWGDQQPENAAKALQIYVSRLRKSLGAERLKTTSAGYSLHVVDGELDSDEFERLAAEGRAALDEGNPKLAEAVLSESLGLWRGPPLADFRFDSFAQGEIRRLEELRAAARADRAEARLARGQAAGAITELEQLVDESPLWERPRGQLMRALYASGRQAEALELYRRTHKLLADEQGLEPSQELQALERAILNQDPALAGPARAARRVVARRGGRLLLLGGLLIAGAAAAILAVLLRSGGGGNVAIVGANSVAAIDPKTNRVQAAVGIADSPARLATDGRSLWVGNDEGAAVSKVDQKSYAVTQVVATEQFPSDVAVGEGAVWVIDARTGGLAKVDPVYGTVTARHAILQPLAAYDRDREGLEPTAVAAGLGSVWLTDGSTKLKRIDPATGALAQTIKTGLQLNALTVAAGSLWAISGPAATLVELDRFGNVITRLPIVSRPVDESPYPLAVAVGAGFVWVLNGNTATVTKIDPAQRTIVATIPIGVERLPVRIAAGHGAAWVADGDGTVSKIDAASNAVTTIPVAHRLKDIAIVGGAVWVTTATGLSSAASSASTAGTAGAVRALPTTFCSPLHYQAGARPDVMIASDLPLQGPIRTISAQINQAILFALKEHRFKAGRYSIAYQSCDDSTVQDRFASSTRCEENAQAYALDHDVIALVAPFSSSCSQFEIPVANVAPGGPLPMISFSNTYAGFTRGDVGAAPGEPGIFYPTGTRSYVRVLGTDNHQGAANAVLARQLGAKRVYIVSEPHPYGTGMARVFRTAAGRLGLDVVGDTSWDPSRSTFTPIAEAVKKSRADAVFVSGALFNKGDKVVGDLRAVLGPKFLIMTPDGFTLPDAVQTMGASAEGMTISVPGVPNERLPRRGKEFVAAFAKAIGEKPYPYAVYAAQATEVLLKAIGASDGTRASVRRNLFRTRISNGILGNFSIDSHGDTTNTAVTIYRIERGKAVLFAVIRPPARLVRP